MISNAPGQDISKGNWHGAHRYCVTRGTDPWRINSRLLVDLGSTNIGDPGPQPRVRLLRAARDAVAGKGDGTTRRPSPAGSRRRPIFRATHERPLEAAPTSRAIAYDEGAADCLDNQELKRVLATAHRLRGRKVHVVGIDACLMTMIEVAYQLRDHAKILVGSEEVEPGPGWRHAAILGDLTKKPTMTPANSGPPSSTATSSPTGMAVRPRRSPPM